MNTQKSHLQPYRVYTTCHAYNTLTSGHAVACTSASRHPSGASILAEMLTSLTTSCKETNTVKTQTQWRVMHWLSVSMPIHVAYTTPMFAGAVGKPAKQDEHHPGPMLGIHTFTSAQYMYMCILLYISYSWLFSRLKTFAEFADWSQSTKILISGSQNNHI